MARPRTGSPRWSEERQRWEARVTLDGGARKVVAIPGVAKEDTDRARRVAQIISDKSRRDGKVAEATPETVNEWAKKWLAARRAKGLTSVRQDEGRLWKWVSPVIGTKAVAEVTRRDLEELVETLDAAVRRGPDGVNGLRWKTATNVWGVVTKMFADACRSKVLALRVREDNPARDVEGPDRGADRRGPYLFPLEFSALIACDRVPNRWKQIISLATYLYVRRGELEALEWSSVNFDQRYVHVHQAVDRETREVKPTKTDQNRRVPIEPTLLPLLLSMHKAAGGRGRVLPSMPPDEELAKRLRKYLGAGWANVERAELFADDETRRPLSWHDLRHTGITWRAVRGDEPLRVQRAAGHDDLRTTQLYINEAQVFDAELFGEVFPPLPSMAASPSEAPEGFRQVSAISVSGFADSPRKTASPAGFEPALAT